MLFFIKQTDGFDKGDSRESSGSRRWLSVAAWVGGVSVLTIFVLSVLFVTTPDARRMRLDPIDELMRSAQRHPLQEPSLWQQAEQLTRQELQKDPTAADLALRLGVALSMQDRFDEARAVLDEAVARHPQDARLAKERALVEYRAGNRDEALRRLQEIAANFPYVPHVNLHIGLIYEQAGQYDKAIEAIRDELNISSSAAAWERFYILKRMRGATTMRPQQTAPAASQTGSADELPDPAAETPQPPANQLAPAR